ncbi:MAG: tRNA (N(6)-L-threonylcarbamoyladenosine(37)-C(2))-methylthiotransferase MtaB [Candidatus Tectomicrobia bacterium]|nr:tRNA (N(6)-L-threonylcarbamoyladenosine(37)-C(2))-methylthiotransferase MtaB [Candidatus Tectomicrobia bacterium]
MATVQITTLGCKLNQFESAAMATSLEQAGHTLADSAETADVYVINTCTVTERSDAKSRNIVRRALRANPSGFVAAVGCYAQTKPQDLAEIAGVDLVLGNQEKLRLAAYLTHLEKRRAPRVEVGALRPGLEFQKVTVPAPGERTRAYLKIQDGCSEACAFCVTVKARGPSRSLPGPEVLRQAAMLARQGYQEIILTGVNLGEYGRDLDPPTHLAAIVQRLATLDGIERIRLSSLAPSEFTPEILDLIVSCEKVCKHLHIPIQSGDDAVLRSMRRSYTTAEVRELLATLTSALPTMSIGSDVIVGFPGESEQHFENSYRFFAELPLNYLHVFPYSKREGTEAFILPGQVSEAVKKQRSQRLQALGKTKSAAFARRLMGGRLRVLTEHQRDAESGLLRGVSENYIKVLFPGPDALFRQLAHVQLVGWRNGHAVGMLV